MPCAAPLSREQREIPKKQILNKVNTNLDDRTQQEEMFRRLHAITAKAIGRQVVTKGA